MVTETTDNIAPICGNCIHYRHGDDPGCRKGKKYWGYLQRKPCFTLESHADPEQKKVFKEFVSKARKEKLEKGHRTIIRHEWHDGIEVKFCRTCGTWKPLAEFHNKKENYDNLQTQCKSCVIEKKNERDRRKRDGNKR